MTAGSAPAPLPARFARLVKIEHTVFALPFAYVGAFLAVNGTPSGHDLLWITLAMVGARSLAMALNRLIDAGIDARNPRTAGREIPSGQLSVAQVAVFCLASLALFLVAVWQLDPIVRWLWPIPVIGFVVYPYLKRVTWLCHFWLGAVDGLAPVGAWVAITGKLPWQAWMLGAAVAFWVAGFDLLLRALRRGDRPAGGAALDRHAVRRPRRLLRRPAVARGDHRVPRCGRARPACRRPLLARRRRRRALAGVRALSRAARRPAAARHGVLHDERRDQRRLRRVRDSRRCQLREPTRAPCARRPGWILLVSSSASAGVRTTDPSG